MRNIVCAGQQNHCGRLQINHVGIHPNQHLWRSLTTDTAIDIGFTRKILIEFPKVRDRVAHEDHAIRLGRLAFQLEIGLIVPAKLDPALLQRAPGSYALYVLNPGLHGTVSQTGYLVIDTDLNPVSALPQPYNVYAKDPPQIFGPSPRSAREDGQAVDLVIEGTRFASNAVVRFDKVNLPTRFVSNSKLTARLDSQLLRKSPGGYVIYVVNPGLNGNIS